MALIQCSACSKEISDSAKACPGCGQPRKKRGPSVALLVVLALVVAGGAYGKIAIDDMAAKRDARYGATHKM